MEIEDNIRRAEELNDILGKMPSWVVRWGSVVAFIIFAIILTSCFIIKYPETLPGTLTITCEKPPANLVARSTGRISLLVKDNTPVKQGDFIAIIENTAQVDEINELKANLQAYQHVADDPISLIGKKVNLPNSFSLGELQSSYNFYKNSCEEYLLFLNLQQNHQKIESYKKQISILAKQRDLLDTKKTINAREFGITQRQFKNDSSLYRQKAISQLDLDKTESDYIKSLHTAHETKEDELQNAEQLSKINAAINELFLNNKDQKAQLEMKIKTSFKELITNYNLWEQKYVLVSPIDGVVSLYDFWNNNQYVNTGDEVAHIVANSDNIFGKLYITSTKFAKIAKGQKVRIILDSYPAAEFGVLFGEVETMSAVNKENIYAIQVKLPKGLVTNYKYKVEFKHEMKGTGEIITEDLSLIERIFYKFRGLFIKDNSVVKKVSEAKA